MTLYDSKMEYLPKKIYPGIDFSLLKPQFSTLSEEYTDYGTLFLIKSKDFSLSINYIGKIICYYNNYIPEKVGELLLKIEMVFKSNCYDIEYF